MRDPVCGMEVADSALTAEGYEGLGFCSEHCRKAFLADPDRYLGDPEADAGSNGDEERS